MNSTQLSTIASEMEEAALATTQANTTEAGYWLRVAEAAETLAGTTNDTNDGVSGYMLRAVLALETLSGTSGAEENTSYEGYLKRFRDAVEAMSGETFEGSNEWRIIQSLERGIALAEYILALDFKQGRYRTPLGYSTDLMAMRGPELVTNGGFDDGLTGWINASDGGGTVTVVDGAAQLSGGATARIRRTITTEIGRTYEFSWAASGDLSVARLHIGNTAGGSEVRGNTSFASGTNTLTFVATATTTWLQWYNSGAAANLDNISVREVPATYTRSGVKAELAASTGLVSFAANIPGIVPGVGYWSRGAVTNLVAASSPSGLAGQTGGQSDPAGGSTGVIYTTHDGDQNAITISTATTYTLSRFLKKYDNDWVRLLAFETANASNQVRVWVNLATGTLGNAGVAGSGFSIIGTPTITAVGGGWYRVSLSFQSATATSISAAIRRADADGATAVGGTGTYAWQNQLVAGTQAGPVIVTTGAAATVGADVLNIGAALADEDFIFWASVDFKRLADTNQNVAALSDGTLNNRIVLYRQGATGSLRGFVAFGAVTIFDQTSGVPLAGAGRATMMIRRKSGKYTVFNRSAATSTTGVESAVLGIPSVSRADVGMRTNGVDQVQSPIEFVGIRRGTFTDAECLEILENT